MRTIPPNRVEWETSYTVPWFSVVHNIPLEYAETIFIDIWDYLNANWEMTTFDEHRKINKNKVHNSILLVEYTDKNILEADKENNTQLKLKNQLQSEPIDGIRQIGESIGDFEYNGKHYLVVYTYNSITNETIPERGIFRWVIIDRNKYDATRPVGEVWSQTQGRVDKLVRKQ